MPSPESLLRASQRHQHELERSRQSQVTIDGRTGLAAVRIHRALPMQGENGGVVYPETASVALDKEKWPVPPPSGSTMIHDRRGWILEPVQGKNATDAAWRFTCTRAPGADLL